MIDVNEIIHAVLQSAIAEALAPLSARLDALERHAPATPWSATPRPTTLALGREVVALSEQMGANHTQLSDNLRDAFEAIARLDARISGLADTLSDRLTALETAGPDVAPKPLDLSASCAWLAESLKADLSMFRKQTQTVPASPLFEAIRAIAENSADEALDGHARTYDHDLFMTEIDEDELGDKIEEYIGNNVDFSDQVKEEVEKMDLDDKIRDYIRSNVSVDLNCN